MVALSDVVCSPVHPGISSEHWQSRPKRTRTQRKLWGRRAGPDRGARGSRCSVGRLRVQRRPPRWGHARDAQCHRPSPAAPWGHSAASAQSHGFWNSLSPGCGRQQRLRVAPRLGPMLHAPVVARRATKETRSEPVAPAQGRAWPLVLGAKLGNANRALGSVSQATAWTSRAVASRTAARVREVSRVPALARFRRSLECRVGYGPAPAK